MLLLGRSQTVLQRALEVVLALGNMAYRLLEENGEQMLKTNNYKMNEELGR